MNEWIKYRDLPMEEREQKLLCLVADSCKQLSGIPEQWGNTVCEFWNPVDLGFECRVFMEKREIESPQEEWYLVVSVEYESYYYAVSVYVDHLPISDMQEYLLKEATWQGVIGDIAMLVEHIQRRGSD